LGLAGFRLEGTGQEEPLGLVDLLAAEMVDLADRLDTFGEGLEAEVRPSCMRVWMRASASGERVMALVNVRSILRQSTGKH